MVAAACAKKGRHGQGNEPLEEKGLWRMRRCLAHDFVVNVFGFSIVSAKLCVRHERRVVVTFTEAKMMQSSGACMNQPKTNTANPMSAKRGGGRGGGLPQRDECTSKYHVPCRNKEERPRHVVDINNPPPPSPQSRGRKHSRSSASHCCEPKEEHTKKWCICLSVPD